MTSVDGYTAGGLHYSIGGEGVGRPTLLLVHAMGADLTFWDACRTIWKDRFRCVAVSLRGAGNSFPARVPLTIERQADDLEALCAELKISALVPVGCAVGAMVAACYSCRHPDQCAALVLSNPGFRILPPARGMLGARADLVREKGMAAVSTQAVDAAFGPQGDARAKQAFSRTFESLDPSSYAFTIEGMLEADVSGYLASIACPTLIVAGEGDALLPPSDHACHVHAGIAGSRYVSIAEGAHFIPYQQPDRFARLVDDFLLAQ